MLLFLENDIGSDIWCNPQVYVTVHDIIMLCLPYVQWVYVRLQ